MRRTILERDASSLSEAVVEKLERTTWWKNCDLLGRTVRNDLNIELSRKVWRATGDLSKKYKMGQKARVSHFLADQYGYPGKYNERITYNI